MRGNIKLIAAGVALVLAVPFAQAAAAGPPSFLQPPPPPAPTVSADEPGRIAYQALGKPDPQGCFTGKFSCSFTFPTVPAGKRLVVTQVSGDLGFAPKPLYVRVLLELNIPGSPFISFFAPIEQGQGSEAGSSFVQPVTYYVEAGQTPIIALLVNDGLFEFDQAMTMTGYLIDCSAANPCQPIAPPPATN
jgi:hypothetical protein